MEASESPQPPLDDGGAEGVVRAIGNRLFVERLTVPDECAAGVVRERAEAGQPGPATVRRAIEIGARLMEGEATAANVDYVKRELQAGLGDLNEKLGGTLEEGAEALAEQLATAFGLERSDSVQAQIKEIVTAESREQREALMSALTAEDPSNPLVAMQVRIGKKMLEAEERHRHETARTNELIGKLQEELARASEREVADERIAEAEEAGTRKGRTFEERVHDAIERIATARCDAAHHTGNEPAEGGGKKGDTLVEVGAADGPAEGRIVFEAKDRKRLSKQDAWRELNGSLDKRAADFAVLVVAGEERIPDRRDPLHEYEGNKMIVAVDREEPSGIELEAAYRLAVARVRMTRSRSLAVDAAAVRDEIEGMGADLREGQKIRVALTGAGDMIASVREAFDGLTGSVGKRLERIERLVAEAEPGSE